MSNFIGIAIVGVIASLIIEFINRAFTTDSTMSKAVTVGISIIIGVIYFFLSNTVIWQPILGILATASTVYAFFLKSK